MYGVPTSASPRGPLPAPRRVLTWGFCSIEHECIIVPCLGAQHCVHCFRQRMAPWCRRPLALPARRACAQLSVSCATGLVLSQSGDQLVLLALRRPCCELCVHCVSSGAFSGLLRAPARCWPVGCGSAVCVLTPWVVHTLFAPQAGPPPFRGPRAWLGARSCTSMACVLSVLCSGLGCQGAAPQGTQQRAALLQPRRLENSTGACCACSIRCELACGFCPVM